MANANQTKAKTSSTPAQPLTAIAIAAPIAGWLLPGAGHLIQKRWIRGLLLLLAVAILFFVGLGMQGKVYAFNTGDLLDILGFFGDLGTGLLYMVSRSMDWGQGAVQRAVADYGTKYIIVAGLLNIVSAVERLPHRERKETMTLDLSHFSAALLFALCASVVFGITQRNSARDMLRYGAYCFVLFVGGVIVAGWAMWLIKR